MRYIIRTIKDGQRIPLKDLEEKRKTLKEKILGAGWNYLESESFLGTENALGERIEEKVYVIEGISEVSYV